MPRVALVVVCLLVGGFLKFPEAVETPGSDTGMFATYGTLLLHGARPYVDFWDLHPPLVYVYWAFVQAITGTDWLRTCLPVDVLAPQSCAGLLAHFLDLVLSVACALVVAAIVRRAGGSAIAAAMAALLVVGFADQVMLSQEGSNPSKLTLVPTTVAVWAYVRSLGEHRRRWSLLAGAAGAIGVLAKQPALLTLGVLVGHAAVRRDRPRATEVLVGAGLTLAAVCVVLAAIGSLDGFVAQAWVYNVERITIGYFVHPEKAPTIGLDRVLAESAGMLAAFTLIGFAVIAPFPRHTGQRLIVAWAAVNVIAITAFREFVYVVPGFAALGALGLERVWMWAGVRRKHAGRALLLIASVSVLFLTTGFQRTQLARARFERGPHTSFSPTEELGLMLRSNFKAGPLFVYGNGAQLYPLSNRPPAAPYLNGEALRTTAPQAEQTRAELISRLRSNPPPLIVLAPHSDEAELNLETYPAMRAFLQECYAAQPISPDLEGSWTLLVVNASCQ